MLRPSVSLWERLADRIAQEKGEARVATAPQPWSEPEWDDVAPGISCKVAGDR
jgi:hypothetical protein